MAPANYKVVYTAFTGKSDRLRPPAIVEADIDYIAYSEDEAAVPPPWQYRPIAVAGRNPRVTSRWYKILPHRHLAEYRLSLWLDANYEIVGILSAELDALGAACVLAARRHPVRDCLYDEAEAVKANRLDHAAIVDIQMEYYRRLGYPAHGGLVEANALFRAHGDPAVQAAMEDWWQQVETFSQRDQLSANFAFWKHGIECAALPWREQSNPWLRLHPHLLPTHLDGEDASSPLDWLRRAAIAARRPPAWRRLLARRA